jgi:DNA-directed RNA polymerase specialized sigma24 family protein
MSEAAVADAMGIAVGTASATLATARAALSRQLEPRPSDSIEVT